MKNILSVKHSVVYAMTLFLLLIPFTVDAAQLTVSKSATAPTVRAGATATYTITVTNTSDEAAADVIITDTLSGNLTLLSANVEPESSLTISGQTLLTWDIGTIPAGGSTQVIFDVAVNAFLAPGSALPNAVRVTSDNSATTTGSIIINVIGDENILLDVGGAGEEGTETENGVGGAGEETLPRTGINPALMLASLLPLGFLLKLRR